MSNWLLFFEEDPSSDWVYHQLKIRRDSGDRINPISNPHQLTGRDLRLSGIFRNTGYILIP
jgi:hypothetical protein